MIYVGGYMDSALQSDHAGTVSFAVYAIDPDGNPITQLLLFAGGVFTGVRWNLTANQGAVFTSQPLELPVGIPAGDYLLELRVRDMFGRESASWPYLTVPYSIAGQRGSDRNCPAAGSVGDLALMPLAADRYAADDPAVAPVILAGGYLDTNVTELNGGRITLAAVVSDPQGLQDIERVELYFGGQPTGVLLLDDGATGDFGPGDSVFALTIPIPPATLPAGTYLLEIVPFDFAGNRGNTWPYLNCRPGAATPTPVPSHTATPTSTPTSGGQPTSTPTPVRPTATPSPTPVPENCLAWQPQTVTVDFGIVWRGQVGPRTLAVTLTNTCDSAISVSLELPDPVNFRVETPGNCGAGCVFELAGGGQQEVWLQFTPDVCDQINGSMTVRSGNQSFIAQLTGFGRCF